MLHPIKRKKGETEEARGARRLIMKLKTKEKEKAGSTITAVIHPKSSCSKALPV